MNRSASSRRRNFSTASPSGGRARAEVDESVDEHGSTMTCSRCGRKMAVPDVSTAHNSSTVGLSSEAPAAEGLNNRNGGGVCRRVEQGGGTHFLFVTHSARVFSLLAMT